MDWIFILIGLVKLITSTKGQNDREMGLINERKYYNSPTNGASNHKGHDEPYSIPSSSSLEKESTGYRWSSGKKPPPAYGDENQGVYDLEVQPGDKKRINHYESKKLRPLDAKVERWHHRLQEGQIKECGYPICVLLDGVPWRFKSICDFVQNLESSRDDHSRRMFHIQKGDCADAIEEMGWKYTWKDHGKNCHACKENEYCNTKVCWAHDDQSKTYENICSLLSELGPDIISGWLGFGECEAYFASGSCIYTEWFDIDHPCGVGDIEQTRTNIIYTKTFKKTGRSRMCDIENIKGNMDIRTVEGENVPSDQILDHVYASTNSYDGEQVQCKNARQTKKPGPPFFWPYNDVKCRDYKVRHCCQNLFGPISENKHYNHTGTFSIITPKVKTIFDDCEWKPFISNCYPKDHEQEDRATLSQSGYKKHVCGTPVFNSMFIDARRRKDDTPFYETGEKLTKVSPTYGLLCSNVNNKYNSRNCSDYKIRFCCAKNPPASWGSWGEWSTCSKTCNGGYRKSSRTCKDNNHKHSCYGKKLRAFRQRTESCNELPCPEDAILSAWRSWSPCSTTCGLGERRRTRVCEEGRYKGKNCPEDYSKYYQIEQCPKQLPCPVAIWARWSSWSKCSSSCGYGVRRKSRICIELHSKRELGTNMHCLGGSHFIDERCFPTKCTVDGGWTEWLNWEDCNVLCGKHGKRIRRRYCAKPIPSHGGKECQGKKIETGKCINIPPCPIHCTWSIWGQWTQCSVSCGAIGSGYRERRRHVAVEAKYGGLICDKALNLESEHCSHCETTKADHCISHCPIHCEWSPWNFVGECLSCYHDEHPPHHLKKYPIRRFRFVKKHAKYNGRKCDSEYGSQEEKITLDCSGIPKCPKVEGYAIWSQWSQWSICTGVCGGQYFKKRTRECIPTKKDSECDGKSYENRKCKNKCIELGWADWSGWSECPVTCGKGKRVRKRECFHKKLKGQPPCEGRGTETSYCDCGPCSDHGYAIETEGENFVDYIAKKYSQQNQGKYESNKHHSRNAIGRGNLHDSSNSIKSQSDEEKSSDLREAENAIGRDSSHDSSNSTKSKNEKEKSSDLRESENAIGRGSSSSQESNSTKSQNEKEKSSDLRESENEIGRGSSTDSSNSTKSENDEEISNDNRESEKSGDQRNVNRKAMASRYTHKIVDFH